jgi:tetraacyldisaccharide 4'-kinase
VSALADKIRQGEPVDGPLGALLGAASWVQRAGMWRKLRGPRARVAARVISFGNITAGGTGKTPAVIERAELEVAAGRTVAVLTRGYGGARVAEPLLHPPHSPADARMLGDEPALIARRVPQAWIVRSADRVAGARAAVKQGCDVILLDDGYQAVALERDENVLVIDAVNPFGNGHILPRGILREPLPAMDRATHVILTRCDQAKDLDITVAAVHRHCPNVPVRFTRHAPVGFVRLADGETLPLETLRGQTANALCAIGHPESFFRTLEGLGITLRERDALRDHATIPDMLLYSPDTIVITEKDAARLSRVPDNVFALAIRLEDWRRKVGWISDRITGDFSRFDHKK